MTKKIMTKTTQKKILLVAMISAIVLVLAFGSLTVTTFALYKSQKKAIIILPGLFGSGLHDSETGKDVWDPFTELDVSFSDLSNENGLNLAGILKLIVEDSVKEEIQKLLANDNAGTADSLLNTVAMNEDSTPAVPSVVAVPWEKDSRLKYGAINAQKDMYFSLQEQFGKEYEVQVFNYDFRLDNRASAKLLEDYINEKGYEEVILISHSNGGQVASIYLARNAENREKVSKYISYNSPYFGSYSAITIMENKDGMISGIVDMLSSNFLTKGFAQNVAGVFDKQMKRLFNMWAVYQLLPSYELLSSDYNGEPAATISVDGVPLDFESAEDLWNFYCSRPWAVDDEGELKVPMKDWLDYKESFIVTLDDGSKVLSTTLVDAVYFSGMEVDTVCGVNYIQNGDELIYDSVIKTPDGDGTVLLSSAAGLVEDTARIHFADGIDHYGVNIKYNSFAAEPTNKIIAASLEEKSNWYEKVWRKLLS